MSDTDKRDSNDRATALRKAVFETFKRSNLGLDDKAVNHLSNVFANAMINGLRAYNVQESDDRPNLSRVLTTEGWPAGGFENN